jgi:hypothetical protein
MPMQQKLPQAPRLLCFWSCGSGGSGGETVPHSPWIFNLLSVAESSFTCLLFSYLLPTLDMHNSEAVNKKQIQRKFRARSSRTRDVLTRCCPPLCQSHFTSHSQPIWDPPSVCHFLARTSCTPHTCCNCHLAEQVHAVLQHSVLDACIAPSWLLWYVLANNRNS